MSAILKFNFQQRKQLRFSEINYQNYKKKKMHVTTTFSLKQGETRTNSVPIPHPLKPSHTFFSSNLWSEFSQCYCIVTSECHISPESLCRELSKITHNFDLVAMAKLLVPWLAKHGNGCIYLTKYRILTILGWYVRYDNTHITMSPDFYTVAMVTRHRPIR